MMSVPGSTPMYLIGVLTGIMNEDDQVKNLTSTEDLGKPTSEATSVSVGVYQKVFMSRFFRQWYPTQIQTIYLQSTGLMMETDYNAKF